MLSLTGCSSPTVKCQTVSRRSVFSPLSQHSDSDIMGWMRSVSVSYGLYQHLLVVCLESRCHCRRRCCCCCSTGGTRTDLSCVQHSHSCTGHQSTAHRSAGCRVWAVEQDLGGLTGWRSVLCSVWEVRGIIDCNNWWPWFPGSTLSLCVCVRAADTDGSEAAINTLDTGISIRSGPYFSGEVIGERPGWNAGEQTSPFSSHTWDFPIIKTRLPLIPISPLLQNSYFHDESINGVYG